MVHDSYYLFRIYFEKRWQKEKTLVTLISSKFLGSQLSKMVPEFHAINLKINFFPK